VASKFQNRLVGTVILVALGVIILPALLDGKKKHYEDEFAAIPLVPKAGDPLDSEVLPSATQPLPNQPPEGAGAAAEQQQADEAANQQVANNKGAVAPQQPTVVAPPVVKTPPKQVESKPAETKQPEPKPKAKPEPKPEVKPKAEVKPKPQEIKPPEIKTVEPKQVETKPEPKPEAKPEVKPADDSKAPAGQAYVVQLGALRNASKANEVVAQLRLGGYRAYTVPSTPVQGEITRIFVGPEASKQKLEAALPGMNAASGLNGQIRPYHAGK